MIKINSKLFMESAKELKLKTDFNITLVTDAMKNVSLVNTDFNTTIIKTLDVKSSSNIYTSLSDSTIKLLSKIKYDNIILEDNTIQAGNKRIKFVSGKSVSKDIIASLLTQKVESECKLTLNSLLKLTQVNYAAAKDCTRPILQGVHFNNMNNDFLQTVSLDGYRLSLRSDRDIKFNNNCEFTVNNDSIIKFQKIAKKYDGDIIVTLKLLKDYLLISFDNINMYCKLLEGDFINYKSLLPDYNKKNNLIEIDDIKQALKDAELISNISELIKLYNNDSKITLNGTDSENELNIDTDISIINWNVNFVAYNPKYLLDAMKNSGYRYLYFSNAVSPGVYTDNLESNDNIDLILPIRIRNK